MLFACPATDDFFRSRIDQMIDLRHPLAVLASRMPWQEIEARVAHLFVRKAHAGEAMPDLDLFGEKPHRVATRSNAGRPRVPLRVMIALLYLKHAFNESDEGVVQRWADTPRWQFFGGQAYYEDGLPCDAKTEQYHCFALPYAISNLRAPGRFGLYMRKRCSHTLAHLQANEGKEG